MLALAIAVLASWTQTGFWDDPLWREALFSRLPADLGNYGLRLGV
jgi:hypothetical protein